MLPENLQQEQSVLYVTILIVLEVLIFIFTLVGKQQDTLMMNFMRILLIIGAHCMKSISWAAYYALFAFITALYIFDPVGLWITGHGQAKDKVQNAFCVVAFLCTVIAAYIGYLYKKALERETEEDFAGDFGGSSPVDPPRQAGNLHGLNDPPTNTQNAQRSNKPQRFEQFSGQGYSLS